MALPPALAPLVEAPGESVLATDFDGTLSPIVDDPATAEALPAARDALTALVPRMKQVAVISGRPIQFLLDRLPVDGLVLVGQYGLEWSNDGRTIEVDDRVAPYLDAVATAAREAQERFAGLHIERKGVLAFTVHWRTTPHLEPAPGALEELAARHGLTVYRGRKSGELRPPIPVNKGTAFRMVRPDEPNGRRAAFAGDDRGDLDVFDALDTVQREGGQVARIAVRSAEAPRALLERADVVVDGPTGLAALLTQLAEEISSPG